METRAHFFIVGSGILFLIAGFFLFVFWMASSEVGQETKKYQICFQGSVAGLLEGGPVNYKGVLVGTVTNISLNPNNMNAVFVDVALTHQIPIKTDTLAVLRMQGLTGNVVIELSGGSPQAPLLTGKKGQPPLIFSKPSTVEHLITSAPEIFQKFSLFLEHLDAVLTPENTESFSEILKNTASFSKKINENVPKIQKILEEVLDTTQMLQAMGKEFKKEGKETLKSWKIMAKTLEKTIQENRESIHHFTHEALPQFSNTAEKANFVLENLENITDNISHNPLGFFFQQEEGYPIKSLP